MVSGYNVAPGLSRSTPRQHESGGDGRLERAPPRERELRGDRNLGLELHPYMETVPLLAILDD